MRRIILTLVVLSLGLLPVLLNSTAARTAAQDAACPDIVRTALTTTDSLCQKIGRNQACYGHVVLQAQPQPDVITWEFDHEGAIVDVTQLQSLRLSVMDVASGAWGVSLMRLQANLPDDQPGKNITMLLFGDVELAPQVNPAGHVEVTVKAERHVNVRQSPGLDATVIASLAPGQKVTANGRLADSSWVRLNPPDKGGTGWVNRDLLASTDDLENLDVVEPSSLYYGPMQAFYFKSGQDDAVCAEAPDSGILIQTPEGAGEVTLLINEVNIQIGSTVYFQAQPDGDLTIRVLEGSAHVSAMETTVVATTGMEVTVPMDGDLKPAGPPTTATVYDPVNTQALPLSLLERPVASSSIGGSEAVSPVVGAESPAIDQPASGDSGGGGSVQPTAIPTTIPPTPLPTAVPPTPTPIPTPTPATKGGETVVVCHEGKTITISVETLRTHLKHGDTIGPCP